MCAEAIVVGIWFGVCLVILVGFICWDYKRGNIYDDLNKQSVEMIKLCLECIDINHDITNTMKKFRKAYNEICTTYKQGLEIVNK